MRLRQHQVLLLQQLQQIPAQVLLQSLQAPLDQRRDPPQRPRRRRPEEQAPSQTLLRLRQGH
ncbi:unnamed protein product [Linum tenue]|uniref:Uncharacterized protein n=1 Tax=Linum tenue TaxID=586396 RepID=A0AAV0JBX0_9ROSI|nr:unnamed protein product [Linum tenue]